MKMHLKILSAKWRPFCPGGEVLTHWARVMHICISKLTIVASDNGLSPGRRQAIIWTNAGILLIGPLGTNFNEILIEIHIISFKKFHLKMSSGKRRPSCLGLNVLTHWCLVAHIYINELGHHRVHLSPFNASHYIKQCWVIINWHFKDKVCWNLNQHTNDSNIWKCCLQSVSRSALAYLC